MDILRDAPVVLVEAAVVAVAAVAAEAAMVVVAEVPMATATIVVAMDNILGIIGLRGGGCIRRSLRRN